MLKEGFLRLLREEYQVLTFDGTARRNVYWGTAYGEVTYVSISENQPMREEQSQNFQPNFLLHPLEINCNREAFIRVRKQVPMSFGWGYISWKSFPLLQSFSQETVARYGSVKCIFLKHTQSEPFWHNIWNCVFQTTWLQYSKNSVGSLFVLHPILTLADSNEFEFIFPVLIRIRRIFELQYLG